MINCEQVRELLDAYALGAADRADAAAVEGHVADCVRCWEELTKAQQTAALLALSVPVQEAPPHLGSRILERAERERAPRPARPGPFAGRWRLGWQTAVGALGVAGVAALAFAGFLQYQMTDLRDEKSDLARQVQTADAEIAQQKQIFAVLSASDSQKVPMEEVSLHTGASVVYNWSRSATKGFLICQGLDPLAPGQAYQVWFTADNHPQSVAAFQTTDGTCQVAMDLSVLEGPPDGIGITLEPASGSTTPTSAWLLYADFTD